MRVYGSSGNGCLVIAIIMAILVMIIGFFGRIIFTTPIGIALLAIFVAKYFFNQIKKSSINKSTMNFKQGEESANNSETFSNDETNFDRSDYLDVEVVDDYKEIDEEIDR